MLTTLKNRLSSEKKRKLKSVYYKTQKRIIDITRSYSYPELLSALRELKINPGDTLMVHSSFNALNGFQGSPQDVIRAFKEAIDPDQGTLLMVSLPYTSSTHKYLKNNKTFHVGRTISRMGLISEIFRRQKGVLRSLHPTHPVCAFGHLAEWFVQDHENCLYPCGPGSPFEKIAEKDGKVLFFDVSFNTFTFIHHIEHLIQDRLPFPLYNQSIFDVTVTKLDGSNIMVKTKAFSLEAVQKRRPELLEAKLLNANKLQKTRVGMTHLNLVKVKDAISCVNEMSGGFFYEL